MSAPEPPLVVDLDGTLIRSDMFADALARHFFARPWEAPRMLMWFTRGRAHAKAQLAELTTFDPTTLPYDDRLVEWLKEQRAAGRRIVLATASNEAAARAIADHLGVFDDVFGSNATTNLKSHAKLARLTEAFPDGFCYAGNESADFAVWRGAKRAIVVNGSGGLVARVRREHDVEREFERTTNPLKAFIKAIRPQQWVKNLLVFLPMLIGGGWSSQQAWLSSFAAFAALSLTASAVYLINDAADIDADRRHPRKHRRPFASGALSPLIGIAAAMVLAPAGLAIAAYAGALPLVATYLVLTTLYSFWLKRVVLADVFLLAILYTIRIVIGGVASGYLASDWLLAFSCFFFLSLALVKRVAETRDMATRGGGRVGGRGYSGADSNILTIFGVGSGLVAALVLALYLQNNVVTARFAEPFFLWVLPAVELFWICRVWMKTDRGDMHDDPIVFAARDRVSWLLGAIAAAGFAAALFAPENALSGIFHRVGG